jgi:hypothetical protein
MRKGVKQYISEQDLPALIPSDESEMLGKNLENAMTKRCATTVLKMDLGPDANLSFSALWKALFVAYGGPYAVAAGLKVIQDFLAFLQPQLLKLLLRFISAYQDAHFAPGGGNGPTSLEGFTIAVVMFIAAIIQTICVHQVCHVRLS